jgi:hypothetical protein
MSLLVRGSRVTSKPWCSSRPLNGWHYNERDAVVFVGTQKELCSLISSSRSQRDQAMLTARDMLVSVPVFNLWPQEVPPPHTFVAESMDCHQSPLPPRLWLWGNAIKPLPAAREIAVLLTSWERQYGQNYDRPEEPQRQDTPWVELGSLRPCFKLACTGWVTRDEKKKDMMVAPVRWRR